MRIAATVVAAACAPPAAWWSIGDLSESGGTDDDVGRLEIDARIESAVGVPLLVLGLAAVTMLVVGGFRGTVSTRWFVGSALLVVAGSATAWCGRVLTADTHGANIGGGLILQLGIPVLISLYVGAVAVLVADHRS